MKKISLVLFCIFLAAGCSPFETARVLGIGTKPFKEQGKVYTKVFNKDFFSCYRQAYRCFTDMGAHFYRGSRIKGFFVFTHFNSSFKQCNESTEVAVFFKDLKPLETEVQVSSLNYSLAEFTAAELFRRMEEITDASKE